MAQFDFSTPINVTMTFEDSDDESSNKNALKDQIKNYETERKSPDLEENKEKTNIECKNIVDNATEKITTENRTEVQTPVDCPNDSSSTKENTQMTNNTGSTLDESINNRNSVIINNSSQEQIEKTHHNISEIDEQLNDKDELTAYVKDLLNTLSEHLILIMRACYNFYYKKQNTVTAPALATQLTQLKTHFYDLSYSTIVTLILPQENNGYFIQKFLDKTAAEANKVFKWKCERYHVEPFYNEMIAWTKRKKEYIKSLKSPRLNNSKDRMNENRILKERLAGPPQPFHSSHLTGATTPANNNNNNSQTNMNNAMCIFSYGAPGREISINVDADTLINHSTQQHQSYDHTKQTPTNQVPHGNKTIYPPNIQPAPRNIGYYDSSVHRLHNYYPQNQTVHNKPVQYRLPPPPYGAGTHMPASMPEDCYYNPNQIHDNIAQAVRNYQIQNNITPYPAETPNTSNFSETYGAHTDNQFATPIITSVTSLNPKSSLNNRRCSMCGKTTNLKCSICNKAYCSYLCKELDAGVHEAGCGKK